MLYYITVSDTQRMEGVREKTHKATVSYISSRDLVSYSYCLTKESVPAKMMHRKNAKAMAHLPNRQLRHCRCILAKGYVSTVYSNNFP